MEGVPKRLGRRMLTLLFTVGLMADERIPKMTR